jgi:hypothetical protein
VILQMEHTRPLSTIVIVNVIWEAGFSKNKRLVMRRGDHPALYPKERGNKGRLCLMLSCLCHKHGIFSYKQTSADV